MLLSGFKYCSATLHHLYWAFTKFTFLLTPFSSFFPTYKPCVFSEHLHPNFTFLGSKLAETLGGRNAIFLFAITENKFKTSKSFLLREENFATMNF